MVICERFLLALKLVPVQSGTLGGEFAEGALDIQEERLSNVAWGMYHATGTIQNW